MCATDQPFARRFAERPRRTRHNGPVLRVHRLLPLARDRLAQPKITRFSASANARRHGRGRPARTAESASTPAPWPGWPAAPPGRNSRCRLTQHTVLDLAAVLVSGRAAAPATAHRAAAQVLHRGAPDHPDLGAEEIAAAIGISPRQLSRVFAADEHLGAAAYPGPPPVPRRLAAVLREAGSATPPAPHRASGPQPVADIAARCGFTSAAYFSHAFHQHFGHRASDLRRAAPARA